MGYAEAAVRRLSCRKLGPALLRLSDRHSGEHLVRLCNSEEPQP